MTLGQVASVGSAGAEPASVSFEGRVTAAGVHVLLERSPFVFSPVVEAYVLGAATGVRQDGSRDSFATIFTPGGTEGAYGLAKFLVPALPDVPAYPLTVRAVSGTTAQQQVGGGSVPANPLVAGKAGTAEARVDDGARTSSAGSDLVDVSGGSGAVTAESMVSSAEFVSEGGGGAARGLASVLMKGIDIGGIVQIAEMRSTTKVTGNAQGSISESNTSLIGVTALGMPATIGSDGVRISENSLVGGDQVGELNKQLDRELQGEKISIGLAPSTKAHQPATGEQFATSGSGGLVITLAGGIPATLPGGADANRLKIVLGHTAGSMIAYAVGATSQPSSAHDAPPPGGAAAQAPAQQARRADSSVGSRSSFDRAARPAPSGPLRLVPPLPAEAVGGASPGASKSRWDATDPVSAVPAASVASSPELGLGMAGMLMAFTALGWAGWSGAVGRVRV